MSTHILFEWHRGLAQGHEQSATKFLEVSAAALHGNNVPKDNDSPSSLLGPVTPQHRGTPQQARRAVSHAIAQQRLALREHKEAARLRPRDVATQQQLAVARAVLRRLQAALDGPKLHPLRRFLAFYNLSIRYWDLGKAKEAIEQAKHACEELRKAGLPCGCAEHNLRLMTQVHAEFRVEHKELVEAVRKSPQAIAANYDLGTHYFDKRMLVRAEEQLRRTRELARSVSALKLVEHDRYLHQAPPESPLWTVAPTEAKQARRMANLLMDIEDDLDFLAGLREMWCVEEESGKAEELQATGVRDGSHPQCLPCLHSRYSQDVASCDAWWSDLCKCSDVTSPKVGAVAKRFAPSARPKR